MSEFTVPTRDGVDAATGALFDEVEKNVGFLPNLYAFIGHSRNALRSYLTFQKEQVRGTFNAREREAIYLAVSEANGCRYCQAAHTAIGRLSGFTDEDARQLRAGTHDAPRLRAIAALASEVTHTRGRPSAQTLAAFFAQGFDQGALVDLVALVADKTMANYLHNIAQFAIDFPEVEPLEAGV